MPKQPSGRPGDTTAHLGPRIQAVAGASVHPVLKFIAGPCPGRVVRLEQPVTTVGRGDENDLVIDDRGVSRQHCRFVLHHGRVVLEDLDSTNGTFVGGERIRSRTLDEGVLVNLGHQVKLRFAFLAPEEKELEQNLYEAATRDSWFFP